MARTKNCRSASGSGNIRKRPNGTWEGRYTAGTDERTGKSIRRSVYGKTQKEVRERMRQITNDIDTGSYVAPCSMKYSEWIDIWLSEYLTGRSPLTISQYKSYAHNHIVPVLGNHRLDELSLAQIQKFINSLAQESLSAKTVKNIYGIMHRCLQQAVTLGYLRHNPSEHCSLPRSLDPRCQSYSGNTVYRNEAERGDRIELARCRFSERHHLCPAAACQAPRKRTRLHIFLTEKQKVAHHQTSPNRNAYS